MSAVQVAAERPDDRPAREAFLRRHGAQLVARRGELVDSLEHPALLAWSDGELVGVATYVVSGSECELLTLHADNRFAGVGSALLKAVRSVAQRDGCTRLWVLTTNDNLDALRFYQRRGFHLARLRPGAVNRSRELLKPEIPVVGDYGIELRDELELEMGLGDAEEADG